MLDILESAIEVQGQFRIPLAELRTRLGGDVAGAVRLSRPVGDRRATSPALLGPVRAGAGTGWSSCRPSGFGRPSVLAGWDVADCWPGTW